MQTRSNPETSRPLALPWVMKRRCTAGLHRTSLTEGHFSKVEKQNKWASLVAQRLKRMPAMRETWVRSLDWEDPLEKEMATHSSILAWRIPWMEEPGGLQSTGSQKESDMTEQLHFHFLSQHSQKHKKQF